MSDSRITKAELIETVKTLRHRVAELEQKLEWQKRTVDAGHEGEVSAREHITQLSSLYDTAPVGLCVVDTDLRFMQVNEQLARLSLLSPAEHIGRSLRDVIPDLADQMEPIYRQVIESGRSVLDSEVSGVTRAEPAIERHWLASCLPLAQDDGTIFGVSTVVQDISKRKQAEESLRKSEERFRTLFENAPIGSYRTTPDGRILDANAALVKMLGYSSFEELAKRNLEEEGFERAYARGDFIERMEREGTIVGLEAAWKARDGSAVFVRENATAIRDANGRITCYEGTVENITTRKQAEEALRESQERFRQIVENAQEWIWEVDDQGLYTYASPVVKKILGYKPKEVIRKKHFYDLFHPEDREELKKGAFEVFAQRRSFREFINRNVHKDGNTVWLSTSGVPLLDEQGDLCGYRGADTDITERKQAEDSLRESEARYRNLFNRVPVGLYRSTPAGRILAANPTLVRMLAFPDYDSLLEAGVRSLYVESSDRQRLLREVNQSGVAFNLVFKIRRYDGAEIWVKENARAIRDATGTVLCYEGSLEDITQRKEAEDALRKERDFSTSLLQASPTFFVAISAKGRTLMMNEAMLTTLGYRTEEVVGTDYLETFVPEADREVLAGVFDKLVHSREPTLNENRVLTKDGRELLVEWRGRPVFKDNGQFDFFFGVGIDITERRQMENEKAEVEAQLHHAHKMRAIGQLAAGVAHDFNSVLTVVLGNAEHILHKIKHDQSDSGHADPLRQIVESVDRGKTLVHRLLTFGCAHVGKPQVLDLNRIVADMERMFRPLIGGQIELEVTAASEIKPIYADVGHIEGVIMNLILNARDAMPDGGKLTLETSHATLDEAYARAHNEAKPGSHTVFVVSDTGIGMNEETLQRLFEPFFSTKPIDQGTGLGLSIVHGIVTQAGGHIEVTSEPGKGATFKLFFPAVE